MKPAAIQFEHVSKRYRVGRSRTLVDLLASAVAGTRRRRDDSVYTLTRGRIGGTIWALRDVSFEVPTGGALGIIGPNGAGKTTILKLIARVTWPTTGRIQVDGRVVSLIELGAGFHPELTGRDNIYLSGSLIGLPRRQVDARFDEIVGFAEVERFIDTPMKRYSSGLYARLGFSVAIHSDPDVVLVDEVLAVGDAAFRRRAMDRLRQLILAGKTVVFISHDMWNVRRLCQQVLWMEEGRVRAYGPVAEVTEKYVAEASSQAVAVHDTALSGRREGTGEIRYTVVRLLDSMGQEVSLVRTGGPLRVRAGYRAVQPVRRPVFQIGIVDIESGLLVSSAISPPGSLPETVVGAGSVECVFEALPLRQRHYALRLTITDPDRTAFYDLLSGGPRFTVVADERTGDPMAEDGQDLVRLAYCFSHRSED